MAAEQERRPPRRAPRSDERGKAAEQTRERILQAAVEEFGAKGYSGARTAAIAARAGVNQQLISYYFGGKQGLLDELRSRWQALESTLVPPGSPFEESLAAYMDATLDRPDWARLVIWRALGDDPGDRVDADEQRRTAMLRAVDVMRHRQDSGEVTDSVDPEFILLLTHAMTFAPVAMPQLVSAIFGVDPYSEEYRRRCREQLVALLRPHRSSLPDHEDLPPPTPGPDVS
ncbi:TetR/AcrR family transcriptional regulator [Sphaerisporangium corydalis]|uniref:TetR family transcriptional regulator n=1 Tax=Sphaerisporangium corydalis TaxID=1441875 RepID=A0ABV9EEC3_9ACTN|nr:TetR/AcrR family transcriptional regulator [Sphaerisporangium corydalis]